MKTSITLILTDFEILGCMKCCLSHRLSGVPGNIFVARTLREISHMLFKPKI